MRQRQNSSTRKGHIESSWPPALAPEPGPGPLNLRRYEVEIRQHGVYVANFTVQAGDARAAIDLVERHYGRPVLLEKSEVSGPDGRWRQVLVAKAWRGYTYQAQQIRSESETPPPTIRPARLKI
jgi:hypothetical protein